MIPGGVEGIRATLRIMSALVKQGKLMQPIRAKALDLTGLVDDRDYAGQVEVIHAYVQQNVRYVQDPTDVETVHTAEAIDRLMAGDCDDHAIYICSLLESVGHPTRFKAIGFSVNCYEHVYAQAKIGERWWAVETTEPVPMGWEPKGIRAVMHHTNSN
jgi:hypothetical protein